MEGEDNEVLSHPQLCRAATQTPSDCSPEMMAMPANVHA